MKDKKQIREEFRSEVFKRDGYKCAICGFKPIKSLELDAHHITSRDLMPFGGYCKENGITLCTDRSEKSGIAGIDCHLKAESLHASGIVVFGYSPNDLYGKIASSYVRAYTYSLLLGLPEIEVAKRNNRIADILTSELAICLKLKEKFLSLTTWELACEELDENDPLIKNYGKGRYLPL